VRFTRRARLGPHAPLNRAAALPRSTANPGADVSVLPLDLASPDSVRAFVTAFGERPLHILVRAQAAAPRAVRAGPPPRGAAWTRLQGAHGHG
jgi:hypothetical protein